MPSPSLSLFGVLHVDRPAKVRAELDEFVAGDTETDADALFIEQPETDVTLRIFGQVAARTPAFFLGVLLHLAMLVPLYAVLNRAYDEAEAIAVRRVADERGLPVHEVDDHPILYMSRAGPRWIAANWLALAVLAWLFRTGLLTTAGVLTAATGAILAAAGFDRRVWLVAAIPATWGALWFAATNALLPAGLLLALLLFYLGSAGVINEHRNRHMLRRVAEVSDREGYDRPCLVTGKAHLAGLLSLAEDGDPSDLSIARMHVSRWLRRSDDVTEDPDPETLGEQSGVGWFRTAFGLTRPEPRLGTETDAFGRRVVAACLDLAGAAAATLAGAVLLGVAAALALGEQSLDVGLLVGFAVSPFCYFLLPELALGRTPGKWLLGLVVVAEDGTPPSRRAVVVRNVLRPLDLLPFYVVGFLSMLMTGRTQRVGDVAAGTVVVRAE